MDNTFAHHHLSDWFSISRSTPPSPGKHRVRTLLDSHDVSDPDAYLSHFLRDGGGVFAYFVPCIRGHFECGFHARFHLRLHVCRPSLSGGLDGLTHSRLHRLLPPVLGGLPSRANRLPTRICSPCDGRRCLGGSSGKSLCWKAEWTKTGKNGRIGDE